MVSARFQSPIFGVGYRLASGYGPRSQRMVQNVAFCAGGRRPGCLVRDEGSSALAFNDTAGFLGQQRFPQLALAGYRRWEWVEEGLSASVGHLVVCFLWPQNIALEVAQRGRPKPRGCHHPFASPMGGVKDGKSGSDFGEWNTGLQPQPQSAPRSCGGLCEAIPSYSFWFASTLDSCGRF